MTVALTDVQLRSLDEIAASMRRSDPRLVRALSSGRLRPRRVDTGTVVVSLVLLLALVVGIAFRLSVVCAAAWLGVITVTIVRGMVADRGY